jgi:hypothetical protein
VSAAIPAIGEPGESFIDYADKWRKAHMLAISSTASLLVPEAEVLSSILVLTCNYTERREKHARIQVEDAKSTSLSQLVATYGQSAPNLMADLQQMAAATKTAPR